MKLDGGNALGKLESLDFLVRPRCNPVLSNYFIELTGIAQARLGAEGVRFTGAFEQFSAFLGPRPGPVLSAGYDGWVCGAGPALPDRRGAHAVILGAAEVNAGYSE